MCTVFDIQKIFKKSSKLFFAFCCVLFLSACGDDCPTVQEAATNGCPVCSFFRILTLSSAELANRAWRELAPSLSILVIVIAAIYVALYTLRMVSSFGKQTLSDYMTGDKRGVMIFMFKATLIYLLLAGVNKSGENAFLTYIIGPLLSGAIEIGGSLSLSGGESYLPATEVTTWDQIFNMLMDATVTFNNSISFISGLGEVLCCDAVSPDMPWDWKFLQLINGTLCFCFGWILLAAVCFYLVDVVIRLAFAGTLLPAGIAMAISRLSMPYAKNIWNLFINVFFSLIMLGIIIGIIIQTVILCIIGNSIAVAVGSATGASPMEPSPSSHTGSFDWQAALDGNEIARLSEAMSSFGQLLLTIVCFAVLLQLVEQMGLLAGDVSDTASASEIQSGQQAVAPMAKAGVQGVKEVGTWAGNASLKGAGKVGHVASRITHLDKGYKRVKNRLQTVRGIVTGTGAQGYRAFWRKWF